MGHLAPDVRLSATSLFVRLKRRPQPPGEQETSR